MFLLDTNILSLFDTRRASRSRPVIDWIMENDRRMFMSAISLTEIETGILKLQRDGRPERAIQITGLRDGLVTFFADRLLPLDARAALETARLGEITRAFDIELADLIIAATAKVHGFTVLTANLRHFRPTGVACHDPSLSLPD